MKTEKKPAVTVEATVKVADTTVVEKVETPVKEKAKVVAIKPALPPRGFGEGSNFQGFRKDPQGEVSSSAPGEPAVFTSERTQWHQRPAPANAIEKVLSKTGAEISEKEFKLLSHGVAINGFLLEPVIKDFTYLDIQTLATNQQGIHLPEGIFSHSVYSQAETHSPFSVYQFELNKENIVLIMDEDSTFWFDGEQSYFNNFNNLYQFGTARYSEEILTKGGAIVLLENSRLKNCKVLGAVSILNGDFRRYSLNNSRYQHYKEINPRFGFGQTLADRLAEPKVQKHPEYIHGSLVNTRVTNSQIANGEYLNSHITDSTLEFGESNYSSVVRTQITTSVLRAKSQVILIDMSVQSTNFTGNRLQASGFTMENLSLYTGDVYAPTKASISKFDAIETSYGELRMIRQSPSQINLYLHSASHNNLVINIADEDEVIRTAVKEWLQKNSVNNSRFHNEETPTRTGVIAKSIVRYTSDNIMSRLATIRLLDEVQLLARNTGSQSGYLLSDVVSY